MWFTTFWIPIKQNEQESCCCHSVVLLPYLWDDVVIIKQWFYHRSLERKAAYHVVIIRYDLITISHLCTLTDNTWMKSSIINAASDHCDVTREQEDTEQWWNRLSLSTITGLKLQSHCEDMKTVLSSLTSSLITHSKCQYSRWYSRATVTNLSVLTLSNDVTAIVSWEVPRDLTVTMVMTLRSWTHPYSVVRWIHDDLA